MPKYKLANGKYVNVSEENVSAFLDSEDGKGASLFEEKKAQDPAKETANVGSGNQAVNTDSNLENGSSDLSKNDEEFFGSFGIKNLEFKNFEEDPIPKTRNVEKPTNVTVIESTGVRKVQLPKATPKKYIKKVKEVKTTASAVFNSNTPYQLGIEGQSITELSEDPSFFSDIRSEIKDAHSRNFPDGQLPSNYDLDNIVKAQIKKLTNKEEDERRDEARDLVSFAVDNGTYDFKLNTGAKLHISEISTEAQDLANVITETRELQEILQGDGTYDEKLAAQAKLAELAPLAAEALNAYDEDLTFMFDNETGRRLTQPEVEAKEAAGEEDEMTDFEGELNELEGYYKDLDLESLEQAYFGHVLEYEDYQRDRNRTIDLKPTDVGLAIALGNYGYEAEDGVFKNVKYSDLMNFQDQEELLQSSIYNPNGDLVPQLGKTLQAVNKDRKKLNLEREAFKTAYLLNIDPGSIEQSKTSRFFESVTEATIGGEATERIGTTARKELDVLDSVFYDAGITMTQAQKDNFERSWGMNVTEGVGAFMPELVKFYFANKVAGAAGITRLIAGTKNKPLKFTLGALLEEAKFKAVTKGESQTGGGVGFFVGGSLMRKIMPYRFQGDLGVFNPFLEKIVLAGPGGALGSEAALFTESVYKDAMNSQAFRTSMEKEYGDLGEVGSRVGVNLAVFALIGGLGVKRTDFKSMAAKQRLLEKTEKELNDNFRKKQSFKGPGREASPFSKEVLLTDKEISQKENLINLLKSEAMVANREFNKLDIASVKANMNAAQLILNSDKATPYEIKAAKKIINQGTANIAAAQRQVNRQFNEMRKSGILGDKISLEIVEGSEKTNGAKALYDPVTKKFTVDILKYKPGVFAQEAGHAFMDMAFKNNPELAKQFKDVIKNDFNKALQGERFDYNGKKDLTFEEAIDAAYGKNVRAEEYVMNAVEFLQNPKYANLLLNKGLLPSLKRTLINTGKKAGFDLSSNVDLGSSNLNRASQLLEFMYSMGRVSEGGSARGIKKNFEKFSNIVIDGKKLIDVFGAEINAPKDIIKDLKSVEITESEKKDTFSKMDKAYKEMVEAGSSTDQVGVMVGYEMEPLVRKFVKSYIDKKGLDVEQSYIDQITSDIALSSGKGSIGVAQMVGTWARGQELIKYVKDNPDATLEQARTKAAEIGIQDRTSKATGESTVENFFDMAKGKKPEAKLTSYIYGQLPKRVLGTMQKPEYADVFNTVSLDPIKADRRQEIGEVVETGFVDSSSPELYTRVSRKKAEVTLGLSPEAVETIEGLGESILKTIKLKDLDATSVGTIKMSDGKVVDVAMLPGDKARYTIDGETVTVRARSPKEVSKSLETTNEFVKSKEGTSTKQILENSKDYIYNVLEKEAGALTDNYTATSQYEAFVDKAFPLFKNYISQSAVNKRFALFKERVINTKTGEQARYATSAGKKVFTKKDVTLAEWRKYAIGDGTKRIDGVRRSLIEALSAELGFDSVMQTLGKEAMREQIESRQETMSVKLVDNYVAVIAKQLDRDNPTEMASALITEVAKAKNLSEKEAKNLIIGTLIDKDGNTRLSEELLKSADGALMEGNINDFVRIKLRKQADFIEKEGKINELMTDKLLKSSEVFDKILGEEISKQKLQNDFAKLETTTKESIDSFIKTTKEIISLIPKEIVEGITVAKNPTTKGTLVAHITGLTGRRTKDGRLLNTDMFRKDIMPEAGKTNSKASPELKILWEKFTKSAKANNEEGKGFTIGYKAKKFQENLDIIQNIKGMSIENKIKAANELPKDLRDAAIADLRVKEDFLEAMLFTIGEVGSKLSGEKLYQYSIDVSKYLLNNDGTGLRSFSSEIYREFSDASYKAKNEHLKAKATFGAEVLDALLRGELNDLVKIGEITNKFKSIIGSKKGQKLSDNLIGYSVENMDRLKMITSKLTKKNLSNLDISKLKEFYNWNTKETAYQEMINEYAKEAFDFPVKADKKAIANNNTIAPAEVLMNSEKLSTTQPAERSEAFASKDIKLSKELNDMIERKKGILSTEIISKSSAANIGRKKGKFDLYLPPNAEDFQGLMYKLYGKGKQGNKDMEWVKENLLAPFGRAENAISSYKQNLAADYKALEKALGEIDGKVNKETLDKLKEVGYNADQAVRVAIWNKLGIEIPNIKVIEAAKLGRIVNSDPRLKAYAEGVMAITKTKDKFPLPSENWFSSNIRYDLFKYANEGVRTRFLQEWQENVDAIFTKDNLNKMEAAYGSNYVKNLVEKLRVMKSGKARPENLNPAAQKGLDYINGSVGVIMWVNTRSAVLQTISAVNYLNWSDNNPIAVARTLANPKEFARTFTEIFNSDFLKQRREGLELNIEEAEIARAVERSKGKARNIYDYLIKIGFKPTQIADSFAIAIGGTPLYLNRTKTYVKAGMSLEAAKKKAFEDFREISEENQQSSRTDRVSNIQTGILGRLIFAFNNTPMQMSRLMKKRVLDLANGRGDWRTNISGAVYYGAIQSIIFYAMQQAAARDLFGGDEEGGSKEESEFNKAKRTKKKAYLANSVIDGFLNGSGLPGKILVNAKNTLRSYLKENKRGYSADYGNTILEVTSISPPLSSKLKKAYSGFKAIKYFEGTKKGKKELKEYDGNPLLNPLLMAKVKIFSGATNIPADRILRKLENMDAAVHEESIDMMTRIALAGGWDKWSLGFYDKVFVPQQQLEEEKANRRKAGTEKAKVTRAKNKQAKKEAEIQKLMEELKSSNFTNEIKK